MNPIKMTSIVSGSMDNIQAPQRKLSWTDFKAIQERVDYLEQHQKQLGREEERKVLLGGEHEGSEGNDTVEIETMIEERYDEYALPESTYSLLMTENVISIPFFVGVVSWAFSLMCLILALIRSKDEGSPGNPFGLPAGVHKEVRMAQYLGIIIGVLMEDEIPQGLELIGKGAEQKISAGATCPTRYFSMPSIVFPALLRMVVGYIFLCCLFLSVVQQDEVLGIFFDVLALEFVENIDDIVFGLSKRGFFGRSLRIATNNAHHIQTSKESHTFRRCTKRFIRFVYIFNAVFAIALLTYVTQQQQNGSYRCNSVTISFGDAMWEDAYVTIGDTREEKRLLIYSHFNGIYKENGTHEGRPKYTEQNKEDGSPFKETISAEIVYCQDIESWVLRHDHIKTSLNGTGAEENECSWLLRTPTTESYDIIELAEEIEWFVWTGLIESDYSVSIECNECDDRQDCNYNGECGNEQLCICDHDHFGTHCQFQSPCKVIRSEKNSAAELSLISDLEDDTVDFLELYGRPMYKISNMNGKPYDMMRLGYPDDDDKYFNVTHPSSDIGMEEIRPHKHFHPDYFADDDFFEMNNQTLEMSNYTFVLMYTGRRWYGKIRLGGTATGMQIEEEEFHAFWMNAFSGLGQADNETVIISAPTSGGSPVSVDFFEMRRRNIAFEDGKYDYDYSPYGVLLPLVEYEGSGFFHCNKDEPNVTNVGS